MTLFTPYSQSLAAFLAPLLDPACGDLSQIWLPSDYTVIDTFETSGGVGWGMQGMVVSASPILDGSPTPIGILVFGTRWDDYFYGSRSVDYTLMVAPPTYLNLTGSGQVQAQAAVGASDPSPEMTEALDRLALSLAEVDHLAGMRNTNAEGHPLVALAREARSAPAQRFATSATVENTVLSLVGKMYYQCRAAVWQSVAKLSTAPGLGSTFPLVCVGLGPAATMAQFAALDLRPGQTGPNGTSQTTPATEVGCYAFSQSPYGDATYSSKAVAAVEAIYTLNATDVDPWPVAQGLPSTVVTTGETHPITVTVDETVDTPWYTRIGAVYGQGLGLGTPPATGSGSLANIPSGFSKSMGSVLSDLLVCTYITSLQTGSTVTIPSPYQALGAVSAEGLGWTDKPWINLYKNTLTNALVISIRGSASIAESGAVNGSGYPVSTGWGQGGRICDGVLELANALVSPLIAALPDNWTPSEVYYSGHDFGAAVACVLAYRAQTGSASLPKPTAIYGNGCQPFADTTFRTNYYDPALGAITFQIQRTNDILTHRMGSGYTFVAGTGVVLNGGGATDANGSTYHAAGLYSQLMTNVGG